MTTLGLLAAATFGAAVATARPASAQDIERVLAGIRLNSKSSNVLAKYGNPNEVVIGDIGFRGTQAGAAGATGGTGGFGGAGTPSGDGGGLPALGGGGGAPPASATRRGPMAGGAVSGGSGAGSFGGGAPSGGFGAPSGGGFGAPAGDTGGGFGQPGGTLGNSPGDAGSTSGAIGPFGQNVSTLARQQEVTWIYNRKVNNNLVTYNFLIGANGNVVQIMVTGYKGGNSRTKRGIGLGSTYKDVVAVYGYPEEQSIVGRTLVASYRTRAHVQFQFLPQTPQSNPLATGNKCIAVTIATVE